MTGEAAYTASYRFTEAEFLTSEKASEVVGEKRLGWWRRMESRLMIVIMHPVFVLFTWAAWRCWQARKWGGMAWVSASAVLMGWGLFFNVYGMAWRRRRAYRRSTARGRTVTFVLTPECLEYDSGGEVTSLTWDAIESVTEFPHGLVLTSGKKVDFWIPAHAFESPAEVQEVAALLRSKVRRYRVIGRVPGRPDPEVEGDRAFAVLDPPEPPPVPPAEPGGRTIHASFVYTEEEHLAERWAIQIAMDPSHDSATVRMAVSLVVHLVVLMCVLAGVVATFDPLGFNPPRELARSIPIFAIVAGLGLFYLYVDVYDRSRWHRWHARRRYAHFPLRGEKQAFELTTGGWTRTTRRSRWHEEWSQEDHTYELFDGFVLGSVQGPAWIPRYAFRTPAEADEAAALMKSKAGRYVVIKRAAGTHETSRSIRDDFADQSLNV